MYRICTDEGLLCRLYSRGIPSEAVRQSSILTVSPATWHDRRKTVWATVGLLAKTPYCRPPTILATSTFPPPVRCACSVSVRGSGSGGVSGSGSGSGGGVGGGAAAMAAAAVTMPRRPRPRWRPQLPWWVGAVAAEAGRGRVGAGGKTVVGRRVAQAQPRRCGGGWWLYRAGSVAAGPLRGGKG